MLPWPDGWVREVVCVGNELIIAWQADCLLIAVAEWAYWGKDSWHVFARCYFNPRVDRVRHVWYRDSKPPTGSKHRIRHLPLPSGYKPWEVNHE